MNYRAAGGLLAQANRAVVITLVAVMALASYNNLAVTASLPDIGHDLGKVALLPWVITVEFLAGAVAVLAVGPFVDGAGARRAFRMTIVCTGIASGVCAAAPSMETLIAARALQGFSVGALIGTVITCIGLVFDDSTRPRVYALTASVWGLMGVGGPAVVAVMVSMLGWRSVFAMNLAMTILVAAVGWSRLSAAPARSSDEPLDRRGLVLMGGVTVALLLAVSGIELWNLALLSLGGLLAGVYWIHARDHPYPVVRPTHVIGSEWWPIHVTPTLAVAGGTGANAFLPLYLLGARGTTAASAAFSILWLRLGWSLAAWAAGRLQDHIRAQSVVILGSGLLACSGAATVVLTYFQWQLEWLFAAFFCLGCGVGTITTTTLSLLQSWTDDHEMGRMTSAHQFLRMLGFSYGAAIAGLVLFTVVDVGTGDVEAVRDLLGETGSTLDPHAAEALASAYTWSLFSMALLSALAMPMALVLARYYHPDRYGSSC